MEQMRKPFQGVINIIRFNWHFYLLSIGLVFFLFSINHFIPAKFQLYALLLPYSIIGVTIISLLVSYYVYDYSDLYKFKWMDQLNIDHSTEIINIHAGFDETSILLNQKFPKSNLQVFDFYDPKKHTELSIKRARKAYPPFPSTQIIHTDNIPLKENSIELIFVILAAHEIRDDQERKVFFQELHRIVKPTGQIIVTEHLRDTSNFLAYNIGYLHFLPKTSWLQTFTGAHLRLVKLIKITPFIRSFILNKDGNTH